MSGFQFNFANSLGWIAFEIMLTMNLTIILVSQGAILRCT